MDRKPSQPFSNPSLPKREIKFYLTSLGCPKNLVESEEMMAKMSLSGMVLVHEPEEADLLIVNTCGFITPAKQESIDVILDLAELREKNPWQRLVVVGCMVQRYREQMAAEIPEIDGFVGVEDKQTLLDIVWNVFGQTPMHPINNSFPYAPRLLATPPHMAYLRISDGCSHQCSYCAIPMIRGKHKSRPMEEIVQEARSLAAGGVKELVIVSQDTTSYGIDLYGKAQLSDLLTQLDKIEGLLWIRLMYTYPHLIDQRLATVFAQSQKLLPYIDMPIQHGDPEILKLMKRGSNDTHIRKAVALLREARREMVIRTTVITGFPGERNSHFQTMWDLLKEMDFDRVGVFPYYREDSTPAADLPNQVADRVKNKRVATLNEWAADQARQKNERWMGQIIPVLIESKNLENGGYFGRYWGQAPEVDGQVLIQGANLPLGEFAPVRIDRADEDNLYGYAHVEVATPIL
ncbi:MAG: 30S ribosomal protein S12 methylthiotransferase RimO [bacterium]|jgi:ribosomal protein S12 methylthiotransferase|nr:30S ribosomal protein S12 methylthiotransferase RimO [bacterium]